jgi:hypothetical protein
LRRHSTSGDQCFYYRRGELRGNIPPRGENGE